MSCILNRGLEIGAILNFFIGRVKGLSFFLKNCTPTFLYRHPHNANISMFRTIVYRIVSHVGVKKYEFSFAAYTVSSMSGNQTNKLLPTLVEMI